MAADPRRIVDERDQVSFTELLSTEPTRGWAVVTFIALLDLYRRSVIDLVHSALFAFQNASLLVEVSYTRDLWRDWISFFATNYL